MGKRKVTKKTKELSVAIAESTSIGEESLSPQQITTPRKRGRPRKIIVDKTQEPAATVEEAIDVAEPEPSKKVKATNKQQQEEDDDDDEEEEKIKEEEVAATSSSSIKDTKKEAAAALEQQQQQQQPSSRRSSRARRKSKPRKSS